ncbi:MAG: hypothetical protein IAE92_10850 [Burkholderiaceae bacterium]|nr:hypothetical protein [Burkholderiaceae bacterium]
MRIPLKPLPLALCSAALLTLAACGGGGGSIDSEPLTPPPPPTTNVSVKVIDGAIGNALVCLDKNGNGACDADETQGRTDANGNVTLAVPDADVGKYRVIAVIGTDAVDADHGPVTTAFTLAAPSDQNAVVSPLTTLVAQTAAAQGLSTAAAAEMLQAISGLPSLMGDYTQNSTPGAATAATVARTLVVTTQQQNTILAPAVGSPAMGGGVITAAEADAAIARALATILPQIVASASNPAVQAACAGTIGSPACAAAIQTQVTTLAPLTGLTPTTLPVQVGIDRSLANATGEGNSTTAGGSLDWLNFTDANNWSYRMFVSSAAESTPGTDGLVRFRDLRSQTTAGTTVNWAFHGDYARRDDMHFNGTTWANCPLGWQNTQTPRDDRGFTEQGIYCGYSFIRSSRSSVDISGQSMNSVVATLRAYPYAYGTTSYTKWGTSSTDGTDKLVLGAATFPAGSKLQYYANATISALPGYDVRPANEMKVFSAAIQAGGDARTDPAHACNSNEARSGAATVQVTTLEQLIAAVKGTPCIYGQWSVTNNGVTFTSTEPSEWWTFAAASVGNIGTAPTSNNPTTGFYTTNSLIRVAFTGSGEKAVTYYGCKQRYSGAIDNCTPIGTGTYTIETLGDGRVLKLNNPPAQTAALTYNRVFVERGGKVYWGYEDKPSTSQRARLNLEAANALFTQIGIPTVTP